MSEEPGPEARPSVERAAISQPVERRPRKWPYIVAIVVLAVGLLGLGSPARG